MTLYLRRVLVVVGIVALALMMASESANAFIFHGDDVMPCTETRPSGPAPTFTFRCINTGGSLGYVLHWDGVFPNWTSSNDAAFSSGGGLHQNQYGFAPSTSFVTMQLDGVFVFFTDSSRSTHVWNTQTGGNDGAFFNLQDDGNMVVYTAASVPIWAIW